jgi:hypothetical protein
MSAQMHYRKDENLLLLGTVDLNVANFYRQGHGQAVRKGFEANL